MDSTPYLVTAGKNSLAVFFLVSFHRDGHRSKVRGTGVGRRADGGGRPLREA